MAKASLIDDMHPGVAMVQMWLKTAYDQGA
jgi:hypothetical protein